MGKSIDLPDPLESTASQPLGNADDLLAQLAGEEVDRLLAEADAEGKQRPKPGEARRADDAPGEPLVQPPVQDQLDALFTEIAAEQRQQPHSELAPARYDPEAQVAPIAPDSSPAPAPKPGASSAPVAPASNEPVAPIAPAPYSPVRSPLPDDVDADEVMAAILGDVGSTVPAPALPPPPAQQPFAPVALGPTTIERTAFSAAGPSDLATSSAERHALAAPDPADELPGPGELEALAGPIEDDRPLPVYLKPLEWMNAPLEMLPSTFRDVLGQAAILTLVNAIAVLIYVFVFRRP